MNANIKWTSCFFHDLKILYYRLKSEVKVDMHVRAYENLYSCMWQSSHETLMSRPMIQIPPWKQKLQFLQTVDFEPQLADTLQNSTETHRNQLFNNGYLQTKCVAFLCKPICPWCLVHQTLAVRPGPLEKLVDWQAWRMWSQVYMK